MDNSQNGQTQNPAPQEAPQQPVNPTPPQHQGLSHDTKTLIVILLLIFAYGVGVIFMWLWMKTWPKWLKIIISLGAIFSIAILALAVFVSIADPFNQAQKAEEARRMLQEEISSSPTPSPFDQDGTPTPPAASASAVQSAIESSLNSENYEDLVPFMAPLVQFEIEASEGVPAGDPQETVTNLAYLDTATPPWNFDQENPIVQSVKTQYAQEYGELYIGISSNDVMAAFGFDENGMINEIKVAATYKLLVN